ncbi:MAG TPA: ABC-2 family transporter protein [Syntrophales bacterium]|nr:ABC-2 family transporter protein [Syntrophales bacterium]
MTSLSKFWLIFKIVWIERMVYRINFFLDILSGILSSLIVVFLWIAIYRNVGSGIIGGYSTGEMVTYLLGCGLLNSFILTTAENPETSQNIQDGTLSTLLIKPFSPYIVWFARDMGGKTFLFMLGLIGYLGILFFFREYLIPFASPGHLLLFVFSVLFAALLQFLLFEALSLLSFWIENTYGIRFTMRVIMEVAGGAIIPLSFFPDILQKFFMLLPFSYMIYLPMQIYLRKIPLDGVPFEFLKENIWIMGLILLNFIIWKRGVRQYVSMGD